MTEKELAEIEAQLDMAISDEDNVRRLIAEVRLQRREADIWRQASQPKELITNLYTDAISPAPTPSTRQT